MIKIIPNFITKEEEQQLLLHIKPSRVTVGVGVRNNIIRYGSTLPYNAPILSKELPDWILPIVERVKGSDSEWIEMPDSITINEYHKGQAIDWHIDSKKSGPIISVLSLKSRATMGLRKTSPPEAKEYLLEPRSLINLSGEQRWKWEHCIFSVPDSRFSIVFRKGTKDE
jgi:alkylated DNA repair dioxygenase AlkB